MSKDNEFNRLRDGFDLQYPSANKNTEGGNLDMFKAVTARAKDEAIKANTETARERTNVDFPPHLFIPDGAESIDARRVLSVDPNTVNLEIFRFVAPEGCVTRFISYGIFNDGDDAVNYKFLPEIDGNRVMRYHGDPLNFFKMDLGLAPDLSNSALIPCQLALAPRQTLTWRIWNNSGVITSMGVRMVGYFDIRQMRVTPKFG